MNANRDLAGRLGLEPADATLVSVLAPDRHAENGLPDQDTVRARERAAWFASVALNGLLPERGLRTSPLGVGWSTDLDAHVIALPEPGRLESLGWIRLDPVLERLGSPGEARWAVVEGDEVLACLDLHTTPLTEPVEALLSRCRRNGEVRLREVLEFRALHRRGLTVPRHEPLVASAARAERSLGGSELAAWLDGPPALPPILPRGRRVRRLARSVVHRRRRTFVVALSGVDGAGKSTLARELSLQLARAGVPATVVWARPGMRLGSAEKVARLGKRLLHQGPGAGVARVASGEQPSALASRRGLLGWAWATLVTLSFLFDVRRRFRRAGGVVLFDRHLLDALVTLDFAYEGVDLRLAHRLIRRFLPSADVAFYLDVTHEEAARRKADDLFGDLAVERQLELYARLLRSMPGVMVLDAKRSPQELAIRAIRAVAAGR